MTLNELNLNNSETKAPYCNFITPPDLAPDDLTPVLLVDLSWEEVEEIALWFKNGNSESGFNVYLYQDSMWEPAWLEQIRNLAQVVIINTEDSAITDTKMRWIKDEKSYYYGPIKFKGSERQLNRPLDWFINHDK
jgi:hypothetical protein